MPQRKSMAKSLRQSRKRAARNRAIRSRLRTAIRKSREAIAAGDVQVAQALVRETSRLLDKATSKGVIHRNAARRRKSRLARRLVAEFGTELVAAPTESAEEVEESQEAK